MKIKKLGLGICLLILIFCQPLYAAIFLNATPDDIRIKEGDPLNVPVFIESEALAENEIELFVYREDIETGITTYLSEAGWIYSMRPYLTYWPMPAYANLNWPAFENTTDLRSFVLHICIDNVLDNRISQGAICGSHNVYIEPIGYECKGIITNPANLSYDVVLRRGEKTEILITIKDACNNLIDFTGNSYASWITIERQRGLATLAIDATGLTEGDYKGRVTISTLDGFSTTEARINLAVIAPTLPPENWTCRPNNISLWDIYITTNSGKTINRKTDIMDNCGTRLTYTARVIQGEDWITTQTSGTGTMDITVNTQGLNVGSYTGKIEITAGTLSGVLNVFLTVL